MGDGDGTRDPGGDSDDAAPEDAVAGPPSGDDAADDRTESGTGGEASGGPDGDDESEDWAPSAADHPSTEAESDDAADDDTADEDDTADDDTADEDDTADDDGAPVAADATAGDGGQATGSASSTFDGPTSDQEMPLTEHIEEMFLRLLAIIVVVSVVSVVVFPFGEEIINFLWDSALPGVDARPRLYSPLELVITQIKVASLVGVVLALPVAIYQSYLFMKPGLYPHERRYYLAAVPTSLVLSFVGMVFGYFVVLPAIFTYFTTYSQDVADIAFALGRTFDLILVLLGYLAVVFQIPLFIMLALMMGLVTRRWLADRRLLFWSAFLGVSFVFSPDPTGMAPIILTVTMIVLFEGTLLLAKWTRRGRSRT